MHSSMSLGECSSSARGSRASACAVTSPGTPGAHHAPADDALELRRVALVLGRAGAVGQAVAECEHHRVARQMLQLGALAAAGERQGENASREAQG